MIWERGAEAHPALKAMIDAFLPEVEERLIHALEDRDLRHTFTEKYDFFDLEALEEELVRFLPKIRFRFGRHRKRFGRYAYASRKTGPLIVWNPNVLQRWTEWHSSEEIAALLTDMILHEVAHLLDWRFCGGWGHQTGWKAWARAAGFVPFGSTSERKRIARSAVLYSRAKETIMRSGVSKQKDGSWVWHDSKTGETSRPFPSRTKARESYKIHREAVTGEAPKKVAKGKRPEKPGKVTKGGTETLWRLGTLTNPKTGRETTLKLRKDGLLIPGDIERTGLKRVEVWYEVRATSRTEALQLIAQGKAQKMTAKKK